MSPHSQVREACKSVGLVNGHAYALLRAIEPQPGLRLVEVQNPWGQTEWNGKYSDAWPGWTDELRRTVGVQQVRSESAPPGPGEPARSR